MHMTQKTLFLTSNTSNSSMHFKIHFKLCSKVLFMESHNLENQEIWERRAPTNPCDWFNKLLQIWNSGKHEIDISIVSNSSKEKIILGN